MYYPGGVSRHTPRQRLPLQRSLMGARAVLDRVRPDVTMHCQRHQWSRLAIPTEARGIVALVQKWARWCGLGWSGLLLCVWVAPFLVLTRSFPLWVGLALWVGLVGGCLSHGGTVRK